MDKKGTTIEKDMNIRLTSVRPGKICRLVGVSQPHWGRFHHHGPRKRKRGFDGFFGNPEQQQRGRAKWDRRHQKWEQRREEWDERKKDWQYRSGRGITKRLLDLGLTKGCTFKVVQGSSNGPILVEVRGTRIALGHELARRVIVEVLGDSP